MTDQSPAIVHLDLDAFYAAVEILEDPKLKDELLIIGGRHRGVVATASFKARESGVHSAMPMARALKLCSQAVVLPPRISHYQKYSRQVMAILREYTPLVEQVSIDEAYMDLTGEIDQWDDAVVIAGQIQSRVNNEIKPKSRPDHDLNDQEGLTASLGVATNKLVAKVASDRDKPRGLTVVRPEETPSSYNMIMEGAVLAPLVNLACWVTSSCRHVAGKFAAVAATLDSPVLVLRASSSVTPNKHCRRRSTAARVSSQCRRRRLGLR
jgi:hypothetical protein